MDYEEKYKDALERARQFSEHPLQEDSATIVEYIFPELAESEDERIKEEIVAYINELADLKNEKIPTKWLAWLEKQGEQPTDKVDTKFNVGDWISGYYTNYKVMAINSKGYVVEDTDGNKINILYENEKFHHLFTITDAKDGDVLVAKDGRPFIFTGEFDAQDDNPIAYCGINSNNKFITGKGSHWTFKDGITPATKEQRELLFHKMKEAEYDWDAEKIMLKKIEVVSKESEGERIKREILELVSIAGNGNQYEEIKDWLEKQGKKLDADKVIAWLVANIIDFEYYVKRFKKDFKL